MNRLYAYIVRWDDGFAPNPFQGVCTLACCKYVTRRVAQVGDYIVGLNSKSLGNRLVYAMQISETMTFDEYWHARRFRAKRPDVSADGEKALGDNIYHWDGSKWEKALSHHTRDDAAEDQWFTNDDTRTNKLLVGAVFTYWGDKAPPLPNNLRFLKTPFERVARGHRRNFTQEQVDAFIEWFKRQKRGRLGLPTNAMPEPAGKGKGKRGKGC